MKLRFKNLQVVAILIMACGCLTAQEAAKSHKFNVVGEVAKPGAYDLNSTVTVLDAIAVAGGLKDFAKSKQIYILRKNADGSDQRLPFNYKDVIKGRHSEQNVALAPH